MINSFTAYKDSDSNLYYKFLQFNFGRKIRDLVELFSSCLVEDPEGPHEGGEHPGQAGGPLHQHVHAGVVHVAPDGAAGRLQGLEVGLRHVLHLGDQPRRLARGGGAQGHVTGYVACKGNLVKNEDIVVCSVFFRRDAICCNANIVSLFTYLFCEEAVRDKLLFYGLLGNIFCVYSPILSIM